MSDETKRAVKWGVIGGVLLVLILVVAPARWPIE